MDLLRDVRYAVRLLTRSPAYSLVVTSVLTIGIGANLVAFGFYQAFVLAPLSGVPASAAIQSVVAETSGGRTVPLTYRDYLYIREHTRSYPDLAGSHFNGYTIGSGASAQRVYGELVTGNYFQVLGVGAQRGRTLLPSDTGAIGAAPVVVISDSFWRRQFDADAAVVGRILHVAGVPLTVVGVTPPDFHGTAVGIDIELFVPVTMQPTLAGGWNALDNEVPLLIGLGRPRAGLSAEQVRADAGLLSARLAVDRPSDELGARVVVLPISESPQGMQTIAGPIAGVMGGTALLLLVVVCANVAGLVLVRTLGRRGEIAARLAVGASRARVVRLLLIENLLLAAPGAALALLLPPVAEAFVTGGAHGATTVRLYFNLGGDATVLVAILLACGSALLCGLVPAFSTSRVDVAAAMKDAALPQAPSTTRLRAALVICQVATSLILLVGMTLVLRSLEAARRANPGFNPANVASVLVDARAAGYTAEAALAFYDRLRDDLRAVGGVEAVSLMRYPLLMLWDFGTRQFTVEGHVRDRGDDLVLPFNVVGPDHFHTLGIPLAAGRDFRPQDDAAARPVAIVNETFARRFWGSPAAALGKRIQTRQWTTSRPQWHDVIGVARDIKYTRLTERPTPYVYLAFAQAPGTSMFVHVRSRDRADALLQRIRERVQAVDPNVPVLESQMLAQQTGTAVALYDVAARVLAVIGIAAIGLAALGIYGLVSYTVTQRTREIGIRVAIGASRGEIASRFVTGGLRLGLAGVVLGTTASLATSRLLVSLLYGVSATDPASFAVAAAAVLAVAAAASLLPAWRAARVDPLVALRHH